MNSLRGAWGRYSGRPSRDCSLLAAWSCATLTRLCAHMHVMLQDKGADKPQLSADELKEELRRHNLQAAKEASERKARREAAAAKKKKTAAQRAKEASQRAAQQKASPAAVEEAMAMEEEMEATEAAAPAERAADKGKAAMPPPPKFRPPRKAPKGVMGQAKKFHRDYPMALWATVAALVLATLLHFILR